MTHYSIESSKAFVSQFNINPTQPGPLSNLSFAVKDNIDVAGFKTSYGSKPWLNTHPPAVCHALCVEQLLNAGASCIGKTISDEFTYSLDGESYFYGTPVNPKAPDRIPGGSSSGSASAVACGLVDFTLGTDCGGSIRVPASHCGILGMRPTLHRISEAGVLPFSPSFSTVGVFANKLSVIEQVMMVLLASEPVAPTPIKTIYVVEDALSIADKEVRDAFNDCIARLKETSDLKISAVRLSDIIGENIRLEFWKEHIFDIIQHGEIWNAIGAWVEAYQPEMGTVKNSIGQFKQLDRTLMNEALFLGNKMRTKVTQFIKFNELFCFPTVPMIPPLKGELQTPEKHKV